MPTRRVLTLTLAAAALTLMFGVGLWLTLSVGPNPPPALTSSKLTFGGPFALTDHSGKAVTDRDYEGSYKLIFFGFTGCPAVCPTTLQTVTLALSDLGPLADRIKPLFISIDPDHDTPKILSEYVSSFDQRIIGLTGTPQQIAVTAKAFHVHYKKVRDKDGSEQIEHTATLFFMAPDGSFVAHIPPEASPRKMADLIKLEVLKRAETQTTVRR